jgi:TolB-like protein/DNA-binding winged helix-turn-helix (wHTH) protein/Tfp pilus assembly protein PilF
MPDATQALAVRRFGAFEINLQSGELRKNGIRLRLSGQPFQVLAVLIERAGEAVTREELQSKVWSADTFVDFDHGLNNAVARIREVLDDSSDTPRYIETIPRRGYRFIAPLAGVPLATASLPNPEWEPQNRVEAAGQAVEAAGAFKSESIALPKLRRRWLGAATIAAMLAAALSGWSWRDSLRRIVSPGRAPVIRSLAVLPLENLTGDASQEYFADGMTDALITDLAQIGALRVISRTSVMRYKGSRKSLPEIARELSVDGIVEGTVMRSGDHVRITSQLIYAPADQHLWARSYERDLSNVLTLQGEVARTIAEEVRVAVTPEERARLTVRSTVNPEAYEANLKGRYFWNKRTTEGSLKAMEYFQQAIDKDQAYAPPYVGLADTYAHLANWGLLAPREAIPKAKAAALKAVELDDRLAEAHVSLGMVRLQYEWDWPAAGKDFERALVLNPASPAAHLWYSKYLMVLRRSDEALAEAKKAVGLDPVSPDVNHQVAWLLNVAGRYDEAIKWERRTLDMDPGFPPAHSVLASAYEGKGMHDEAVAEAKRLLALSPDTTDALGSLAYIHARTGERSQALRELASLGAFSKHKYVPSIDFATAYLGLGDKEQAFRWLEKACEERSGYLPWVTVSAKWAPLRSDPQYSDLLRCMGLPE